MLTTPSESASIRLALAVGFFATLGLWLYTGYAFDRRMAEVQTEASAVAARYMRAQELLATVRSQVLLSAVRVRDGLLDTSPATWYSYREAAERSHLATVQALNEYEPVVGNNAETQAIDRLRHEVELFHDTSLDVLADAKGKSAAAIREILNGAVVPRRDSALTISEEIQALNRRAFIQQQADIAEIHAAAEAQSRIGLGVALVIGLGVLLMTSVYAGRLEGRLRSQLKRDIRITRELHETATKLIGAQEEERRKIAGELHDEVGQVLTAIKMELSVAQRKLEASGASSAPLLEAQAIADGALQTVRNLTQLLHPAVLDDLGLAAAIDAALRGLARRHDIRTELKQEGMAGRLPREVELAAYRIVQEALTNIARHARASRCSVQLTHLADRLLVEVEDDGVGFRHGGIVERGGLGLVSVRERATRLGGTFDILSAPGEGTRLIVTLPDRGVLA